MSIYRQNMKKKSKLIVVNESRPKEKETQRSNRRGGMVGILGLRFRLSVETV